MTQWNEPAEGILVGDVATFEASQRYGELGSQDTRTREGGVFESVRWRFSRKCNITVQWPPKIIIMGLGRQYRRLCSSTGSR